MKQLVLTMALGSVVFVQDQVPEEILSPNLGSGAAADFLKAFAESKRLQDQGEAQHTALLLLTDLPDTREYLGHPLAAALQENIHQSIFQDVKAAAWADVT
jgi:hypothetical protein